MDWQLLIKRNISWTELSALEEKSHEEVLKDQQKKILIVSEPTPTYTYGRNADENDLLWAKDRITHSGAAIAKVARGGKWTYHGSGQILLFPIFHLPTQGFDRLGVRKFMDQFRKSIQKSLLSLGLPTEEGEEPFGLFKNSAKLVSFGLAFKNGISTHGASVYVTPQHERFQAIHPCGVLEGKVSSLTEHLPFITWEDTAANLTESVKIGLIPT